MEENRKQTRVENYFERVSGSVYDSAVETQSDRNDESVRMEDADSDEEAEKIKEKRPEN